ncbi:MAG TPA: DUF2231 domain-containing protein [Cytophagaceae bacterium]
MRSKANFKTHPIHPMLVPFPIGFLVGAFIFDVLALISESASLWTTGGYLIVAGIIAGLITAMPGIIDYIYTVPPQSSAKKRATKHALVNVTSLILFAIAYFTRGELGDSSSITAIVLELVGVGCIVVAGWLGGTLVYRNQIGIDLRYAGAGKWKEEMLDALPGDIVEVGKKDELKVNQMKLLHLDGKRVVLARTEEGFVAFDDHCTHRGGSLASGSLACNTVQCPWHGSQFDVRTGKVKAGPAQSDIRVYKVEIKEGKIVLNS